MSPESAIKSIRSRYHDALMKEGVAERVHEQIERRSRDLNLSYGDRVVCQVLEPLFIHLDHYQHILMRAEALATALAKLARDLRAEPALLARLRLNEREQELIGLEGGFRPHDLVGRMDAFLAPSGEPMFLEYNGESPGGIAYGDCLGRVFDELPLLQELAAAAPMSRRPVIAEVVRCFRSSYQTWAERRHAPTAIEPQVAIVDLAGIPTRGEFELFRQGFLAQGLPCRILCPEDLVIEDGRLRSGDEPIDIVYRRLVTRDLFDHLEVGSIIEQIPRQNVAYMANGFEGYLLCHKGLFALLAAPDSAPKDLTPLEQETIAACVPATLLLEAGTFQRQPEDEPQSRLDFARRERHNLVLKLALGYGGKDVFLGWHESEASWDEALQRALQSGRSWVLQERVQVPVTEHPALVNGKLEFMPLQYDLDPYILLGRRAHGLGVRLSTSDILNVASGFGSAVPAYICR